MLNRISCIHDMPAGKQPFGPLRNLYPATSRTLALLAILIISSTAKATGKWNLKKNCEGIKIYTATQTKSDIKALRAEFTTKGNPGKLTAILMNVEGQKDWIYSTESSSLVKKISDNEMIYYTEKHMPWPVANRDAVMHLKIIQDPFTKIMTVHVVTVSGYVPVKKDIIRVPSTDVTWVVTPIDANTMEIVYEVLLDPGGSVPSWVVNMFTAKGPFETFKKLKSMLAG